MYNPNIRMKPNTKTKKIIHESPLLTNTVKLGH